LVICWLLYAFTLMPIPVWFFLHVRATLNKHGYEGFQQVQAITIEL
jgi:hypothetical protein